MIGIAIIPLMASSSEVAAQNGARRSRARSARPAPMSKSRPKNVIEKVKILKTGTSSDESQAAAKKLLPMDKVSPKTQRRMSAILKKSSLYRELPSLRFEVDPKVYLYFIAHPDVAVSIWRAMNISKFQLQQRMPTLFKADGGDGTKGDLEIVYRGPGHVLVICDGVYKNPLLFKAVKTQSLIHLQATFDCDKSGRTFVTHRVFLHVAFPSTAVKTAAKMLSPLSNMILDQNFREISLFLNVMSRAMAKQPGWVENIADRMQGLDKARKPELLKLTAQTYVAAQQAAGNTRKTPPVRTANRVDGK